MNASNLLTTPNPENINLSIQMQLYKNLSREHWPLIPFMLINFIATHYHADFMRIANKVRTAKNTPEDILNTSCVHTAFATSCVFFGKEKSEHIFSRVNRKHQVSLSMPLPSGEKFWYTAFNTFAGEMIREMNKDKVVEDNDVDDKLKIYSMPSIKAFFYHSGKFINENLKTKHQTDEEAIQCIKSFFATLSYNFNEVTVHALKNEISNNKTNLSLEKSYIYYVGITAPEKNIEEFSYDHAFVIEQFYPNKFRIYQSWVKKATLLQDIVKRNYDDLGKNVMDETEMNVFLARLDMYLDVEMDGHITPDDLFGYDSAMSKLISFDGNNKLSSVNLRYYSSEISPQKCIDNVEHFIETEPEFRKRCYGI